MTATTPYLGPLYPMPPVLFEGAELLAAIYELGEERVKPLLPPPLKPGPLPLATSVMARYPTSTVGPYLENVELLQVQAGERVGLYVPFIYVTTDVALAQGREIWGFPKKLADISLTVRDGGASASVRRGTEILRVEGSIDLTSPVPTDIILSFFDLPVINLKRVPTPDGKGLDVDYLTAAPVEYRVKEAYQGEGSLSMEGTKEDPLHLMTPEDPAVLLFYVRGDMSLMPGTRL